MRPAEQGKIDFALPEKYSAVEKMDYEGEDGYNYQGTHEPAVNEVIERQVEHIKGNVPAENRVKRKAVERHRVFVHQVFLPVGGCGASHEKAGEYDNNSKQEQEQFPGWAEARDLYPVQEVLHEKTPFPAKYPYEQEIQHEQHDKWNAEKHLHVEFCHEKNPENLKAVIKPEPFIIYIETGNIFYDKIKDNDADQDSYKSFIHLKPRDNREWY